MLDALLWQLDGVRGFLQLGGPVLWLILCVAALIGFLVTERYLFINRLCPRYSRQLAAHWQCSAQRYGLYAAHKRAALISEARRKLRQFLPLLKILVALCPLLGLLGTVTGMVEVFDVVAVTGTGDARAMASGIARAILPTMAGMVVALPGLYFSLQLEQRANRALGTLQDELTHG